MAHNKIVILLAAITIASGTVPSYGQFLHNDTLFLFKDLRMNYDVIYLTRDSTDKQFNFLQRTSSLFRHYSEKVLNRNQSNSGSGILMPGLWFPIYLYQNKPYLYLPSDPISNRYIFLENDTLHYEAGGDIYKSRYFVDSAGKKNPTTIISIDLNSLIHDIEICSTVFKYVYLFVIRFNDSLPAQPFLFVHESNLRKMPLIVHYSPAQKAFHEMVFDEIDSSSLCK